LRDGCQRELKLRAADAAMAKNSNVGVIDTKIRHRVPLFQTDDAVATGRAGKRNGIGRCAKLARAFAADPAPGSRKTSAGSYQTEIGAGVIPRVLPRRSKRPYFQICGLNY
jgi:hypothetical protein